LATNPGACSNSRGQNRRPPTATTTTLLSSISLRFVIKAMTAVSNAALWTGRTVCRSSR
jgi:hypothetical protein